MSVIASLLKMVKKSSRKGDQEEKRFQEGS